VTYTVLVLLMVYGSQSCAVSIFIKSESCVVILTCS